MLNGTTGIVIQLDWANVSIRRRMVFRSDTGTVLVHEADASPAQGGEALLWPPIAGPSGVLLRHAIATEDGRNHTVESQRPWFVQPGGTVARLPFELGVSPLLALPDGRWLLPGADALWRDDYDEPLSILDAAGTVEPLIVPGFRSPAARRLASSRKSIRRRTSRSPSHLDPLGEPAGQDVGDIECRRLIQLGEAA